MDNTIKNTENLEIQQLVKTLCCKNGMERKKARIELVTKGKIVIDYLMELINHPKHIYRWEALKTLEEISDPASIPTFIKTLEDDESDIRWIAAEGLIKLGAKSIKPLLKIIIEKPDSIFFLVGVHHVFFELYKTKKLPAAFPIDELLSALRSTEKTERIKPLAYELLNKLK